MGAIGAAIGGSNIAKGLSAAGDAIKGFFTKTVPEKFGEFKEGATKFFTETVPQAVSSAGEKVKGFFTETIPQKWDELVTGIGNFFTETVPYAIGYAAGKVQVFFTETIPTTLETVGDALSTFFTETVPGFFQNLWDGIVGFFTESIPNAIESVGESISGFFSSVKKKISKFFGGLWDKVTGSASAGYEAATAKHAEGGIMTRPHMGLVAEDGAEAIIPLSGKRRERGIDLWEKTGKMLGVKPYAEGGIAGAGDTDSGNPDDNTPAPDWKPQPPPPPEWGPDPTGIGGGAAGSAEGGMTVPVTIQSLTFEVHVDGSGTPDTQTLVETIKENVRSMTDEIAYQLAVAMQQAFANTPRASWEG